MLRPLAFLVVVFISAPALANLQTTAPTAGQSDSAAPRGSEPLKATVTAIQGMVDVREGENAPWKKPTVGMVVGENAEFRTGPRSAVQFSLDNGDHVITLDRLGVVKVLEAVVDNGKVKTSLGMKYGRTRYTVEAAGREHESSIVSPSSTLAVRGTDFIAYDQRPFPMSAVSREGRVSFRDFKKRTSSFGGKGKAVINANNTNAAEAARERTVVDPSIALARSNAEATLIDSLLSRGATVGFDYDKGIKVVRGGTVPQNDNELIPTLPGTLNFVMRWQGNTDLNLGVVTPGDPNSGNLVIYPQAGFDITKNGGVIPFDHRGGPNGGMEVAFFPSDAFPRGSYIVGGQWISGEVGVPGTLDVFLDGKRVPIRQGPNEVLTATFNGAPVDPSFGAAGFGIGTVRFQSISQKQAAASPKPAPTSHKRNKR